MMKFHINKLLFIYVHFLINPLISIIVPSSRIEKKKKTFCFYDEYEASISKAFHVIVYQLQTKLSKLKLKGKEAIISHLRCNPLLRRNYKGGKKSNFSSYVQALSITIM